MRKAFVSALMMILLLLTGCGQRESKLESEFAAFREALRGARSLQAELSLHWDSGERVSQYGLALAYENECLSVTVTEPELIAGIRAVLEGEDARLEYEGVMLGAAEIAGLSPVSAAPAVLEAMAYGYRELLWREDGYLAVRLWMEQENILTLWLEEGVPLCAEIAAGGQTIMTCHFEQWQMN